MIMYALHSGGRAVRKYLPETKAEGCSHAVLTQHHLRSSVNLGKLDEGERVQAGAALWHRLQPDLRLLVCLWPCY